MTFPLVTDETFDAEVTNSDKLTLVKFEAEWCQPCKVMTPVVEKLALNNPELNVVSVDIDESYEITKRFKVRGVPTFIAFKNGKPLKQHTGTTTEAKLLELFR
jgi:thioredoxin 1